MAEVCNDRDGEHAQSCPFSCSFTPFFLPPLLQQHLMCCHVSHCCDKQQINSSKPRIFSMCGHNRQIAKSYTQKLTGSKNYSLRSSGSILIVTKFVNQILTRNVFGKPLKFNLLTKAFLLKIHIGHKVITSDCGCRAMSLPTAKTRTFRFFDRFCFML